MNRTFEGRVDRLEVAVTGPDGVERGWTHILHGEGWGDHPGFTYVARIGG